LASIVWNFFGNLFPGTSRWSMSRITLEKE